MRAYKKTGKEKVYGKWSAVKTVTTQNNVPDIYSITSKKNSITVTWNKVVGGKGYQVQYATDRKFKKAKTKSVNDNRKNSITITGLKYGEKYHVRIRVLNKKSASGKYGQWGSTMTIKVGLPNPDHLQTNMDATKVPETESKADTTEASETFESDSVTEETSPSVQVNPNMGEGEAQPSETETEITADIANKEASVWGFYLDSWTNAMLYKMSMDGNANGRTTDGGHEYYAIFLCNGGKNWAEDVEFVIEDVTPNAYRKMYDAMGVESGIVSQVSEINTQWPVYNYGDGRIRDFTPEIFEPLDSSEETPPVHSEKASAEIKLTINAKMGSRCLKVTAVKDEQILDIVYLAASPFKDQSASAYHPKDLELYAAVRHKAELVLWKNCATNLDKICAVADYISSTTHYPGKDFTSQLHNPTLWKEWSVDGINLYYWMGADVILNETMVFQGGITTCLAAKILSVVAQEDMGLSYLYNSSTKEILPGEGVWIGSGGNSLNPGNPNHYTLWYKDDTEIKCGIDAQGMGYDGSTDKAACEEHKCADKIIPLV